MKLLNKYPGETSLRQLVLYSQILVLFIFCGLDFLQQEGEVGATLYHIYLTFVFTHIISLLSILYLIIVLISSFQAYCSLSRKLKLILSALFMCLLNIVYTPWEVVINNQWWKSWYSLERYLCYGESIFCLYLTILLLIFIFLFESDNINPSGR